MLLVGHNNNTYTDDYVVTNIRIPRMLREASFLTLLNFYVALCIFINTSDNSSCCISACLKAEILHACSKTPTCWCMKVFVRKR